ncbi:MAG: DUF4367 domain-containing protein, partial [Halobacteria archaeon]|nr:DUF4367 domain-containing protein [Halobacteria archaeon]
SPRKSVDQVWVSQQTGLPVKILRRQSGTGQENAEVITTVAYRNMEFNTTFPDGFFTVSTDQLPSPDDEGQAGNQSDVNVSYKDYDTIESAQSAVGFDILVPSALPESYTLNKVTVKTFEGNKSARLKYANATSKMMILETVNLTPRGSDLGGKAKTVQVSGSQGTYLRLGGIGILRWNCGKYSIEVSGEFGQQKLIDIAESFSCNQ